MYKSCDLLPITLAKVSTVDSQPSPGAFLGCDGLMIDTCTSSYSDRPMFLKLCVTNTFKRAVHHMLAL